MKGSFHGCGRVKMKSLDSMLMKPKNPGDVLDWLIVYVLFIFYVNLVILRKIY